MSPIVQGHSVRKWVKHYSKSLSSATGTAVLTVAFAVSPWSAGGEWFAVTDNETGLIVTAVLAALGVTAVAPKNGPRPQPAPRRRQRDRAA